MNNQEKMLNEYYVLVDTNLKQVIDKIQKLPEYWRNISQLKNFNDEELKDLTWAGQTNIGWINIQSEYLQEYKSTEENLELNKNQLKSIISGILEEKQISSFEFNNIKIVPDEKTRYIFWIKRFQNIHTFNYKINQYYYTFDNQDIIEICDRMEEHIQKYTDIEMSIYQQIDACQELFDLSKIEINI